MPEGEAKFVLAVEDLGHSCAEHMQGNGLMQVMPGDAALCWKG